MTTTNSADTERRAPRAMVALIVLATELPMPLGIRFQGEGIGEPGTSILGMDFDRVSDGQAWSRYLGGQTDTYRHTDGNTYLCEGPIRWHGWSVQLCASERPMPDGELDQDTTTRLGELTGDAA